MKKFLAILFFYILLAVLLLPLLVTLLLGSFGKGLTYAGIHFFF